MTVSFDSYFGDWINYEKEKKLRKLKKCKVYEFDSYVLNPPICEFVFNIIY